MKEGWISGCKEQAKYCGMCVTTLWKLNKIYPMPRVKIGRVWKTTAKMLDDWLRKISDA